MTADWSGMTSPEKSLFGEMHLLGDLALCCHLGDFGLDETNWGMAVPPRATAIGQVSP